MLKWLRLQIFLSKVSKKFWEWKSPGLPFNFLTKILAGYKTKLANFQIDTSERILGATIPGSITPKLLWKNPNYVNSLYPPVISCQYLKYRGLQRRAKNNNRMKKNTLGIGLCSIPIQTLGVLVVSLITPSDREAGAWVHSLLFFWSAVRYTYNRLQCTAENPGKATLSGTRRF
jgi:hypothetical protein